MSNVFLIERVAVWLYKTQGRDKLCKIMQYVFRLLSVYYSNSTQLESLFEGIKQARKIFRLFKGITEWQQMINIMFDDGEDKIKILELMGRLFFVLYWFFDNISILSKIKLFKKHLYEKYTTIASIFWLLSVLFIALTSALHLKFDQNMSKSMKTKHVLTCIKFSWDFFPAAKDSKILDKIISYDRITECTAGIGGLISACISTYQAF